MRQSQTRHFGLPFIKLGVLAVRQLSKPVVSRFIKEAKAHVYLFRVCVFCGRISLGLTGVMQKMAQMPPEEKGGSGPTPQSPVAPKSAETLESLKSDKFTDRPTLRRPVQSVVQTFRRRFYAPVPEKVLCDAGAEVLVEVLAYLIAALILAYEYASSTNSAKEKEAYLLARIDALEEKVRELATEHPYIESLAISPASPVKVSVVSKAAASLSSAFVSLRNSFDIAS